MMKSLYKKTTKPKPCYYCDYCTCRKGHKCHVYKATVKDKDCNSKNRSRFYKELFI